MKTFEEKRAVQDALQEIGNIGTGSAVSALSRIAGESIDERIPRITAIDGEYMAEVFKKEDEMALGILLPFEGDLSGILLFICKDSFVSHLLKEMISSEAGLKEMNEYRRSLVKEVINIMASSYFNAVSVYTGKRIHILAPAISIDMVGAIAREPAGRLGGDKKGAACIESGFSFKDEDKNHIALLFDQDSVQAIIEILEISV